MIINSGISSVVYKDEYDDDLAEEMLKEAGIKVRKL
jgi:deoxycytidylate deaminase